MCRYQSLSLLVFDRNTDSNYGYDTAVSGFRHISLPLDALCAHHGCNGEPHVFLRVMLEITCSCYFYTNLSVAFLVYFVVRSLLACLVCCCVRIWFVFSIHWTSSVGRFISSACYIPSATAGKHAIVLDSHEPHRRN
jgi:hypothetical protein